MSKNINHQFSLDVLGVHIASFWAATFAVKDGTVWFNGADGVVLVLSEIRPGVTIQERSHHGEWRTLDFSASQEAK